MCVHVHTYLEIAISIFYFLLPIKHLVSKQMFIKGQLCARHCTVLAVVRMMLGENHWECCSTWYCNHSPSSVSNTKQTLKTHTFVNLINTMLAYTNYNIWLLTCLFFY